MTLRALKKRSKQALPILRRHYPASLDDQVFLAVRGENYHGLVIRCTHGSGDPCRVAGSPRCECTSHPLPGTPMTGGVSGYYEPEWDERTVYEVLADILWWTGRPETMTDAEWAEALRVVGLTPAEHAARLKHVERSLEEMARDVDGGREGPASPSPTAARSDPDA